MNRKYTTEEFARSVSRIRDVFPDAALTTDVITGFPGEENRDFEETVAFVENLALAGMHIFPFSPKKGTPAANFEGQIQPVTKNERAKILKHSDEKLRYKFLQKNSGKKSKVLFETEVETGVYEGYTTNYIKVRREEDFDMRGMIFEVVL